MNCFKYLLGLVILTSACKSTNTNDVDASNSNVIPAPANLNYELVKVYPHDTTSYTQGLEWNGDKLIEGTGLRGKSVLKVLDTTMNTVGHLVHLDKEYFGEGTTLFNNKIYQLTWEEHKVFVYDAKTLKKINELYWPYEGWGLTHNDTSLIISTGGSNIYFVDPNNFSIKKTLGIFDNKEYVTSINELEYVNGKIYANIYGQDKIIVIDPVTGSVTAVADFTNLLAQANAKYDPRLNESGFVLNGIAYKKETNTFFVTGKCWPVMVEIKFK